MKTFFLLIGTLLLLSTRPVAAQMLQLSHPHGFYDAPFQLALSDTAGLVNEAAQICYTLDGSEPSALSTRYTGPITVKGNTLVRAAIVQGDSLLTPITTATYLFLDDVLNQSDSPEGYPSTWGEFTTIEGVAPADYGMDPEMTQDARLAPLIRSGLLSLPVLSIVTDRDNLFSHERDSVKGGIYIFTGPPVGDDTGHGWTRPANVEMFGQGMGKSYDFSVGCGLRLHGGHGRIAEKNPKHSFRLVFKKEYGKKTLKYPLFGEEEPDKFDQLILRCHFGNSWQHWATYNHEKAQYARDVWARRMQRKMGHTSVNALYVHLFLNGMYWGLYNIAERVDDQFGKDHLGGKKEDIDVIKVEESGGNHLEAAEGDMEAWEEMVETVRHADIDSCYYRLQGLNTDGEEDEEIEALLDIDAFIDYMLINQWGGNNDWDHHNWYALRRKGTESQGFRFLCWDSELIIEDINSNVMQKNNGADSPTGIFHSLLGNKQFAKRYLNRAKEVLADDGLLGPTSTQALWDSIHHVIYTALYDEAARWGDYRRDVHPYQTRGSLYTVDDTYMAERNRLEREFFPYRSEKVQSQISSLVYVDEYDMKEGWIALSPSMFHQWDGTGADAQPLDRQVSVDWCMRTNAGGGAAVAGFVNVDHDFYADLTDYDGMFISGTGTNLRILTNRLESHGDWKEIKVSFNENDPHWEAELGGIYIDLSEIREMNTHYGAARKDPFIHLHTLKVDWGCSANVRGVYLIGSGQETAIDAISSNDTHASDHRYRDLTGRIVTKPNQGIFLQNRRLKMIR